MIKIAITGGIGSGKSYVSHLLEDMHVPVYNADNEAKRLMVSDEEIRRGLVELLGIDVYRDGVLDKKRLASYLFSDASHTLRVNEIVHPCVRKDFVRWVECQTECEVVGMESAILYEAGFEDTVDAVVMVYAPVQLRIQRAMYRDGATEEQVRARMSVQMDDGEKCRRADFVVVNDGSRPLGPQLTEIIQQLKTRKFT